MNASTFWRTVIAGSIATFVMTMIAFLQSSIGLPVIDVGHILTESFNHIHESEPYSIIWGNMAYNITGVLLALIWVAFLKDKMPGNLLVQGILYGVLVSIVAGGLVSPFVSQAAGEGFGFFYTDTWVPGKVLLAGLLMHLGYGLTLMITLKIAGITTGKNQ